MKTRLSFILTLFLIISLMAGCAAPADTAVTAAEGTDDLYQAEAMDTINPKTDTRKDSEPVKRVGVAMPTKTSERWINDGMSIKAKLETLGYEVDLQYADDDIDLQVSQIESMIRNDVSALVIASIDSTRLVDVLKEARDNGIAVIAYDRLLMDTDAVSYYASFDNKMVGTLIGEYIRDVRDLEGAKNAGKSYTIEFFMGSPDDNNALFLYEGLMEVLRPYLDNGTLVCRSGKTSFRETCILRWSEDTAAEMCTSLLKEYYPKGDLDIACSAFDGFAYGILKAWQKSDFAMDKRPLITGQDAEKSAVRNIAADKMDMTIYKDTRVLAAKCVTMVQALLEGGEPEINDTEQYNNNVLTVPSYLCTPVTIDKDNYEEILIGGGYYTKEQLFE
ncbi:MAG: sugar-binding protein [Lachnospiraceae bacterium]|nr:sugar-binding protein [Lachnospiraceae bacterium]